MTCRAPAAESDSPGLFILDSKLRTPPNARLFCKTQRTVTLLCTDSAPKRRFITLQKTGATVTTLPANPQGQLELNAVLTHLGTLGINTVLVEAGTGVTTAMLGVGLVDKIYWTQSQHILGADSRPVVGPLKLVAMPAQNLYTQITSSLIGQDQLRVFVRDFNQDKIG